ISAKGNGTEAGFLAKVKEAVKEIQDKAEAIFAIKNPVGSMAGAVIMEDMDSIADRLINGVFAAHIAVDSAGLYAVSQEVESLWARWTVFMFAAFAVLASAAIIFAFYYSGRFVRPLEALRNGAERLASGNIEYRVDVRTGDEVEALGRQFNIMAERLKGFYEGLEQEVRKRTGELRQERDKLFTIFNSMEDGVLIISRDYNVEFANPMVERDFGPYEGAKCYEYLH
ncbi:MAG: HAMP domain-containing protein, partial [Deltaproteobacteria bacterium]